jgi:hypothetical protein
MEDLLKTELGRLEITHEIDASSKRGHCLSSDAEGLLSKWLDEGDFFIPEKDILYYRVRMDNPSSTVFKVYLPLIQAAKKFFPMYCQGVAATIAKICLTETRREVELTRTGVIHLFVHDQMVVSSHKDESEVVGQGMKQAVEDTISKAPFDIPFRGTLKTGKKSFADVS